MDSDGCSQYKVRSPELIRGPCRRQNAYTPPFNVLTLRADPYRNAFFLWIGQQASPPEIEAGRNYMNKAIADRKRLLTMPALTSEMKQGSEPDEFWELLGGMYRL